MNDLDPAITAARMADPLLVPDPAEVPTLSVDRAAEIVGISAGGLYEIIKGGSDFPVIRIGRKIRIPTAALREYLRMPPPSLNTDSALAADNARLRAENDRLRLIVSVIRTAVAETE